MRVPEINPATTNEQGGAHPNMTGGMPALPKVQSPLQLGNESGIISASGVGAQGGGLHLNPLQFLGRGGGSGDVGPAEDIPEDTGVAEGAETAGEAAEGAGIVGDLADVAIGAALL
jgi:hypothetical protein